MRTNGTPNGPAACASSHRQRRKWWTALAVLAVLVVLGTVAALTMPASTMSVADMATPETAAADAENSQAADAPAQDPNATAPAENTPDETAPAATPAPATPESAALPEEAAAQAAAEVAALPDAARIPEGYTAQRTVRDEENGFAVTVYAPDGVIPEDAVLSATLLDENQEEYKKAEQDLIEQTDLQPADAAESDTAAVTLSADSGDTTPATGFAALDIHFEDADGNEIEPNGDVYVSIDATGLLPEDADPESVTVQHHAEQDNAEIVVETVADAADATDGVVEVKPAEEATQAEEAPATDVQAAFQVESFSTFTISWSGYDWYTNLTVRIIDSEGNDIPVGKDSLGSTTLSTGEWVSVDDILDKILANSNGALDDYTFDHVDARDYRGDVINNNNAKDIKWIRGNGDWDSVTVRYSSGDNPPMNASGGSKLNTYYDQQICFVFNEKEQGGGDNPGGDSGSTEANVTVGKSAVLNEDTGNYTLELSVTGDQGSEENPAKVDVLLVVDKSGSMKYDLDSQSGSDRERMKAVVTAVKTLTDTLDANNKVDVRYDLVTFSSLDKDYTSEDKNTSWTANSNVINDAVSYYTETGWNGKFSHDLEGGTNYQYAFYKAKQALNSSRGDAQQIVIFLTDGIPTHKGLYSESQDNSNGEDTWDPEFHNTDAAINELRGLNADAFYCIGVGEVFDEASDPNNAKNGKANLERIVTAAKSQGLNSDLYTASSTENLQDIFRKIAGSTTFFAANNVVMTDPLSQYADIVPNADGNWDFTVTIDDGETPQTIPVTVEKEKGSATFTFTDSAGTKQTATVEYIESTKNIKLTFPAAYQLEEGYTYSISTTITPSQTAKDAGMGSGAAQMTPEENTGTHWEQKDENGNPEKGFWSNDIDNAKVTYKAITTDENGNETSSTEGFAMFPKPVIRVQEETTANLTIVKNIYGLSQDQVVNLVNGEYQTQCDKGDHTHGLRFDVDYFGNEEDAKNDNWDNESDPTSTFIDDWTFDVKQTLDANDEFVSNASDTEWSGDIQEPVDLDTPDDKEGDSYMSSSLTYVANTGEEPYYRYTITIKDAKLEDWYHVWETNTEVTGYDLEASVKAVNADGEDIENIAENTHDNKATAFQLTDDTTVTFTNRYTHSPVTVNFKKVDATNKTQGLAGAQFKLFYIENDENKYYSNANDWTATEEDAKVFTSEDGDTLGTLTLPALEVGRTYYLTEVTAPEGYQLLTDNIQFEVKANGDIYNVKYVGGGPLDKVNGDQGSTDTTTPPTYLIPNSTGTELPETGGRGTNFLTIGGLLMMAAAAGGYVLRRRRGKEAR